MKGFSKKAETYLSFLILATFAVIIGLMVFWQAFDNTPLIRWDDVAGHKQTVSTGDKLKVYRQFCVERPVTLDIEREIRDGVTYQLPESRHSYEEGCYFLTIEWTVPDTLRPGFYVYDSVVSYDINPLRKRQDRLQPFFFVVRNPDGTVPNFRAGEYPADIVNSPEILNSPELIIQEGYTNESIQIR